MFINTKEPESVRFALVEMLWRIDDEPLIPSVEYAERVVSACKILEEYILNSKKEETK